MWCKRNMMHSQPLRRLCPVHSRAFISTAPTGDVHVLWKHTDHWCLRLSVLHSDSVRTQNTLSACSCWCSQWQTAQEAQQSWDYPRNSLVFKLSNMQLGSDLSYQIHLHEWELDFVQEVLTKTGETEPGEMNSPICCIGPSPLVVQFKPVHLFSEKKWHCLYLASSHLAMFTAIVHCHCPLVELLMHFTGEGSIKPKLQVARLWYWWLNNLKKLSRNTVYVATGCVTLLY